MMHIPSVSWSSEVLRLKAEVLARAMEKDPRVADLAPVIRGAADRLAAAAETAHATRLEERACRATFDQCEEEAVRNVRIAEALARATCGADRTREAYRAAFPKGLSAATHGKRDAWMRRAKNAGEALAAVAGLETAGKALIDAVTAAEAARTAWTGAERQAELATQAKNAFKAALVEEFRVQRAAVKARLRKQSEVDALFPDLAAVGSGAQKPGANGNGTGTGADHAAGGKGTVLAAPPEPGSVPA